MSLKSRGICVIVPTCNNAGTIADVVQRCLAQCDDVIVVCDGCTDGTADILRSLPVVPDILELEFNRGKGAALMEGFRHALSRGFSYAITIDADGQHFPEDIPLMLQANVAHPGCIIVGSRKGLENVRRSAGSRFANAFSNFWFTVQTGRCLEDTQTGYRLYPLKKLPRLALITSRYESELELLVLSLWKGTGVESVPVNVYYPSPEDRVSHFRPVRDFTRISILNTVLCILALVYGYPRMLLRTLLRVVRSLEFGLFFSFFTLAVFSPMAFFCIYFSRNQDDIMGRLHGIIHSGARLALFRHKIPGARYTQVNNAGETFEKPAVIICNHQSHLDLLPLLSLTPKLVVLTNDWVWHDPFYGMIIRHAGYLPTSRGIDAILPELKSLVARGYSIAVYPEGTRSSDCSLGRFHQGAFKIAGELGLDIVPLVLYGTGKVMPKHRHIFRKWPIHMEIDSRITPSRLSETGSATLSQASAMRKYYKERYTTIADRIEQNV